MGMGGCVAKNRLPWIGVWMGIGIGIGIGMDCRHDCGGTAAEAWMETPRWNPGRARAKGWFYAPC